MKKLNFKFYIFLLSAHGSRTFQAGRTAGQRRNFEGKARNRNGKTQEAFHRSLVSEQTSCFQILILDILFFLICKFEYWMHNEYIIANNDRLLETNLIRNVIFAFSCPICGIQFTKNQNRDHVSWHFMDELREIVNALPDPTQCTQCEYTSDKVTLLDQLILIKVYTFCC